jgi:1-acyl-sn-glycerol-3-phosphate acyltransferase
MADKMVFKYPRRKFIRAVIHRITRAIFNLISDYEVIGEENFPKTGPLIVVGNHFCFLDPVSLVSVVPWPIEFVGGFRTPNAPAAISWLRESWGYYPVFRGTGSTLAFRATDAVLAQNGVMAIFPEGSSAAGILRPPRPGAAFMAARAKSPILPLGMDGLVNVFPQLLKGKRAKVTIRIGKPFDAWDITGRGRERRQQLDEFGHHIMRQIAELLPSESRGYYSSDPAIRKAAEEVSHYQWDEEPEG